MCVIANKVGKYTKYTNMGYSLQFLPLLVDQSARPGMDWTGDELMFPWRGLASYRNIALQEYTFMKGPVAWTCIAHVVNLPIDSPPP